MNYFVIWAVNNDSHSSPEEPGVGEFSDVFLKDSLPVENLEMWPGITLGKDAKKTLPADLRPHRKF